MVGIYPEKLEEGKMTKVHHIVSYSPLGALFYNTACIL